MTDVENSKKKLIIAYTILFIVFFFACCQLYFSLFNKTYAWKVDGLENTYPMFVHTGEWWKKLLSNIFVHHKFVIPMWDMSIGYGADVITSLGNGFNNFYNPFQVLAVIFPRQYSEAAFEIMLILEMYIAGLCFIKYSRYKKNGAYASLAGSLVYVFSSTTLIVFKQTSFAYVFVLFPLIILGLEYIRDGRKPYLYIILIVGYSFINALISAVEKKGKAWYKSFDELKLLLKIAGYSIYSCLIGVCLILPSIFYIMQTDRLGVEHYLPLFYDKNYSGKLFGGFISAFDGGTDYIIGYSVLALICCMALFVIKGLKARIREIVYFVLLSICLFIPFIGHVFNGFNYATNRWIWGYAFLVAYIVTIMFDKLYKLSIKNTVFLLSGTIVYAIVLFCVFDLFEMRYIVPLCIAVSIIIFMHMSKYVSETDYKQILLLVTACTITIPAYYYFSKAGNGFIFSEVNNDTMYEEVLESGGKQALKEYSKDEVYRYDTAVGRLRNSSLLLGISGYDMYNSAYHNGVDRFNTKMGMLSATFPVQIDGVDKRSDLEALFGTRYLIYMEGDEKTKWPYGFTTVSSEYDYNKEHYTVYTSDRTSSIFTFFDKVYSKKQFDESDPYNRQQMIMNGIVLDEKGDYAVFEKCKPLDIKIDVINDFLVDGSTYKTNGVDPYIDISFEKQSGMGEYYLYLEDLIKTDNIDTEFKLMAFPVDSEGQLIEYMGQSFSPRTTKSHMYGGKKSWLLNFGYRDADIDRIRIYFKTKGEYKLNDIKLYYEDEDAITKNVNGLIHPDVGVRQLDNSIYTTIETDKDGYLLMTLPYSQGWTAYVDGKEENILQADEAFMGIKVNAGVHDILLVYKTPYLYSGLILGFILILFGILTVIVRKKVFGNRGAK